MHMKKPHTSIKTDFFLSNSLFLLIFMWHCPSTANWFLVDGHTLITMWTTQKNHMNYDLDNYNDDDNINNERVACIQIYLRQQFVRFLCKIFKNFCWPIYLLLVTKEIFWLAQKWIFKHHFVVFRNIFIWIPSLIL